LNFLFMGGDEGWAIGRGEHLDGMGIEGDYD
jgi:hypothetical protein